MELPADSTGADAGQQEELRRDNSESRGPELALAAVAQGKHHKSNTSPGRTARQVLQTLTRKLGRPDVGDPASALDAALALDKTQGKVNECLLHKGEQQQRQSYGQLSTSSTDSFRHQTNSTTLGVDHSVTYPPAAVTAEQSRAFSHNRRESRTVQPSAAPRRCVPSSPSCLHTLPRRNRGSVGNATSESGMEPAPNQEASAGPVTRGRCVQPREEQDNNTRRRRQRMAPSSANGGTLYETFPLVKKRKLSRRSPLARYTVLSVLIITLGLIVRYQWKQVLSGLAGALLILTAAHRWMGNGGASSSRGRVKADTRQAGENLREAVATAVEPPPIPVDSDGPKDAEAASLEATVKSEETDDASKLQWDGAFAGSPPDSRRFWEDAGPKCQFVVRGANYMIDRKKVSAGPAAMRLVHVDFFAVKQEVFHVASKGRCRDRVSAFTRSFEAKGQAAPFLFILNILVPGEPVVCAVMYWALAESEGNSHSKTASDDVMMRMIERYAEVPGSGYKKLDRRRSTPEEPMSTSTTSSLSIAPLERGSSGREDGIVGTSASSTSGSLGSNSVRNSPQSLEGGKAIGEQGLDPWARGETSPVDASSVASEQSGVAWGPRDPRSDTSGLLPEDDFRNQRFKLIPNIVSGPFIVRKAVGNKPALLGRKLHQRYYRAPGYIETDVDVGSSIVAEKIVSLCRGYARSLTVELGICLEGRCAEELPEKCIGVIRLVNLDLDGAEPLEDPTPTPKRSPSATVEVPSSPSSSSSQSASGSQKASPVNASLQPSGRKGRNSARGAGPRDAPKCVGEQDGLPARVVASRA